MSNSITEKADPAYRIILGSGGFGKVYLKNDISRGMYVAVKVFDRKKVERRGLVDYVLREARILRKMNHKYIVKYINTLKTDTEYRITMEFAPNGELFDKIVDVGRFDEATARQYFQQLIQAVNYCHQHGVVHRDLKAENLLLAKDNTLRLCDFGLARDTPEKFFDDSNDFFMSLAGSIDYQAPEILIGEGYQGTHCDMWACGCLLFFMLCGYLPFADTTDERTKRRILNVEYNCHDKYLSEGAGNLIAHLLVKEPKQRYSCGDVMNDPWYQGEEETKDYQVTRHSSPVTSHPRKLDEGDTEAMSEGTECLISSETEKTFSEAFQAIHFSDRCQFERSDVRNALMKSIGNSSSIDVELEKFLRKVHLIEDNWIAEHDFWTAWTEYHNSIGIPCSVSEVKKLLSKEFLLQLFNQSKGENAEELTEEDVYALGSGSKPQAIKGSMQAVRLKDVSKNTINFDKFVELVTNYELLKHTAKGFQWRSMGTGFEESEAGSLNIHIHSAYTVSGEPSQIRAHLITNSKELHTTFENDVRSGLLYGRREASSDHGELLVSVRLQESVPGYTRVSVSRIGGQTKEFRDWYLALRKCMKGQLLQYESDTAIAGKPELL